MGQQPVGPAPTAPGPHAAAPLRRQTPTWVVVAATAGVMVTIGIAFVVGVFVGAYLTNDSTTTTSGSTGGQGGAPGGQGGGSEGSGSGGGSEGSGSGGGGGGTLDECVVGTWRTTEHTEDWSTDQGEAQLSGLERTMVFTADGTQTVTYDGESATITSQGTDVPAVFDGEVVYRTSTSGGTMSFSLVSAEGSVTVDPEGTAKVEELKPGTGDVSYTCDDTTLRQEADGYLSVYERTG